MSFGTKVNGYVATMSDARKNFSAMRDTAIETGETVIITTNNKPDLIVRSFEADNVLQSELSDLRKENNRMRMQAALAKIDKYVSKYQPEMDEDGTIIIDDDAPDDVKEWAEFG
jgi:PHD/YefM family antitoxin component YafN of YafNO toxin-antitoxin module